MDSHHPHYHVTHAKISTHDNFMETLHPRQNFNPRYPRHFLDTCQNFMDPPHPIQNFDPQHPRLFFDPRQNFTDPCHPRQSLTHNTHKPTLPTPLTLFSRLLCHIHTVYMNYSGTYTLNIYVTYLITK